MCSVKTKTLLGIYFIFNHWESISFSQVAHGMSWETTWGEEEEYLMKKIFYMKLSKI